MTTQKHSVFKTFLFTYIIIIFIPIITSVILYLSLLSIIDNYNEEKFDSMLAQSQQIMNQYLDSISNISHQILSNQEAIDFMSEDIFYRNSFNYQPSSQSDLMKYLNTYVSSNPILDDIYLYSSQNGIFITSKTAITQSSYGSYFQIGGLDYASLQAVILESNSYNKLYPQTEFIVDSVQKNCFFYLTTLPYRQDAQVEGCLIISVDSAKLFSAVEKALSSFEGYFYFYNVDQQLIAYSDEAPKITDSESFKSHEIIGKREYTIYKTQNPNAYNYAIALPSDLITSSLFRLRIIISIVIFLICIVCAVTALYFSKLNTQPIKGILSILQPYSEQNTEQYEYIQIRNAAKQLVDSDIRSKEVMRESMPILRANFVSSILNGSLADSEEINQRMERLGINFSVPYYAVLLISIKTVSYDIDLISKNKITVTDMLRRCFYCLNAEINENDIVYILGFESKESSMLELEHIMNKIDDEVLSEYNKLAAAVSAVFDTLSDAFYHYQEVKNNMDYGIQTTYKNIIWCTKNTLTDSGFFYPSNLEERIITSFKKGNIDIVRSALEVVMKKNSEECIPSKQMRSYLYSNISCTILKILYSLNIPQLYITETEKKLKLASSLDLQDFFQIVDKLLLQLHNFLSEQQHADTATAMMNYIDMHYNDPSLCRQSFSERFNISEVYTSSFFKKHTGYRFTEYVTKVRMEAACNLLKESSLTVSKIAEAVGYNNDASFRRVFISYTGTSPKEYRAAHSKDTDS